MTRILLALLAIALPALAQTTFTCTAPAATFTCTPTSAPPPATCTPPAPAPSTQACPAGQQGAITTSYSCVGSTWTPVTVNTCSPITPPPVNVVMRPLGNPGVPQIVQATKGVVYSSQFNVPKGIISFTVTTGSPGNGYIKTTISPTPGDMGYYLTPPARYMQWGGLQSPCGATGNVESGGGLMWAPAISCTPAGSTCSPVPNAGPYCAAGGHWYINYTWDADGPFVYTWNSQQ